MPVAAGVVGDAHLPAVVALLDMTAQRRRAAGFDRRHDAALALAQMAGMGLTVSGAVAAEHLRHLEGAAHAGAQPGGTTSSRGRRSSGLGVPAMTLVATRV